MMTIDLCMMVLEPDVTPLKGPMVTYFGQHCLTIFLQWILMSVKRERKRKKESARCPNCLYRFLIILVYRFVSYRIGRSLEGRVRGRGVTSTRRRDVLATSDLQCDYGFWQNFTL